MRRILVDQARSHAYQKRGGGVRQASLDEAAVTSEGRAADIVALDDALTRLAAIDRRKSQVVELRFFAGLSTVQQSRNQELNRRGRGGKTMRSGDRN